MGQRSASVYSGEVATSRGLGAGGRSFLCADKRGAVSLHHAGWAQDWLENDSGQRLASSL